MPITQIASSDLQSAFVAVQNAMATAIDTNTTTLAAVPAPNDAQVVLASRLFG